MNRECRIPRINRDGRQTKRRAGRWFRSAILVSVLALLALVGVSSSGHRTQRVRAERETRKVYQAVQDQKALTPQVVANVAYGESMAVRDLPPATANLAQPNVELSRVHSTLSAKSSNSGAGEVDAAIDDGLTPDVIPGPELTFEGNSTADNLAAYGFRVSPPTHTGDVGPNHYVQATNLLVRIFNKTGTALTTPFKMSSLYSSLTGPCATRDDGDPQVLYDPLADRWLLSDFCTALTPDNKMSQRIAISTTGDPTGTYHAYIFVMPNTNFNDFPMLGVWPDGYYMAANQFTLGGNLPFLGAGAFAFDRARMLIGDPSASFIYFDLASTVSSLLPTDVDGYVPPPTGTPNLFMGMLANEFGDPADALALYEFRPNFSNPGASTFTQLSDLPLAAFDARNPTGRNDIEQPPPATGGNGLDSLSERLMPRVAYRNLGTNAAAVNSYALNFAVNVSGVNPTTPATYQAGIRWTELRRNPGTGVMTVSDQGTFAPDAGNGAAGANRWAGSIAQDNQGNTALGFSISSTALFPSINWAGRLTTDPAGTLGQGETTMFASTGVQNGASNRWGDYSSMTVDPSDDCTFWYTNQYRLAADNAQAFDWHTRVGKFKFPACTAAPKGTFSGTITNCSTGLPIQNAVIETTSPAGFHRLTNASGQYTVIVAPGTYNVSASNPSVPGFNTATGMVTVTNGGNAVFNACIQPSAVIVSTGATLNTEACGPANGSLDPGELVTVSLCVQNVGSLNTTNLTGTLQAIGGVTNIQPPNPQNYGALTAGGAVVCRDFTFRVDNAAACGSSITATVQLQDGATNLGAATYNFTLGTQFVALSENFDGVVAPATPAGWTSTEAQDVGAISDPWATSTTTPDTAPNSVFTNDPGNISDERLETPNIPITSSVAQLTFRNSFNLETNFDGGVLEISIGGGAFADIITAGGSFVAGGYTGTINSSFGSPIAGRMAWSGNSVGYITTTINLPAAAAGQNIKLRWRRVTDNSTVGVGWRIDTVRVTDGFTCCVTPNADLSVSKTDSPDPINAGENLTYTVTVQNTGPNAASNASLTDAVPSGTTFVSATQTLGPAFTLTTPPVGGTGNVNATVATFASGATATFQIVVRVNSAAADGSTITNTASVSSTTADFNPANNSDTETTTVHVPNGDLSITKVDSVDPVNAGDNLTYTVTLQNGGPDAAGSLSLTDAVPSGTTFVSASQTTGPAFTLTTPPAGGTGNVTATAATFANAATATFNIVVKTNPLAAQGSTISNTASVSSATADFNSANNTATEVTTVRVPPLLPVTASIGEGAGKITLTVTRSSNTPGPATVDFATVDGAASQKGDYAIALGTLSFASGETSKTIDVFIVDDNLLEGNEAFTVALSNPIGDINLGASPSTTVTISDNDSVVPVTNPIDDSTFFVRQHYLDFLNREPDAAGLAFWVNNIEACGSDAVCREVKRIDTSASFFLSTEFQATSGYVIRLQRAAFGKKSGDPLSRLSYLQFIRDSHQVGQGVVVLQPGFEAVLENNQQIYAGQVVNSAAFIARFSVSLNASDYVDALFASAGVTPGTAERNAAIAAFGAGGTAGRIAALRSVANSLSMNQMERNVSFVLLEYFGYLRRNPTDAPDPDDSGYQFWLTKLNTFNGDFRAAEMVKAFITSFEYRKRFSLN